VQFVTIPMRISSDGMTKFLSDRILLSLLRSSGVKLLAYEAYARAFFLWRGDVSESTRSKDIEDHADRVS
jgi:hypothetical protein